MLKRVPFYMMAFLGSCIMITGCAGGCGGGQGVKRINGGGATFVDPIMQKWSAVYKEKKGIEIDYKKTGSGNGIQQVTARTLDFGCSDAPMNKEQTETAKKEGGDVVHVPVVMGAVALIYNLPGIDKQLILDSKVIADIYLGNIKNWDHEAILALNPELKGKLPASPIVPVYRAESSGTTNIFTEYLNKAGKDFPASMVSSAPKWPQIGTGQNGNDGIAAFVSNNANTIGYVEVFFAQKNNIKFAKLTNKKGTLVSPDDEGAVAAAAVAGLANPPTKEPHSLHELTFSLTDTDGDKAYPICGISYAILYKKQPKDKGKVIVEFLKWASTEGQEFSKDLGYSPLPDALRKQIGARLDQVQFE
ncbi:MAG: phosphate ABC transporter substrate-binding protein PstS [Planctomycetes bacterium]|nr:phosphate ABC transporter substrate-binding protein PstS [Planctomycetota bacterium]